MFCFQCEQTKSRRGCVQIGVCGKTPQVAKLQDLLTHAIKGLAIYAHKCEKLGLKIDANISYLICSGLFATVTNVNFDPERFPPLIGQIFEAREALKGQYRDALNKLQGESAENFTRDTPAGYQLPPGALNSMGILEKEGEKFSVTNGLEKYGATIRGVRELTLYGLRGAAAYYAHARELGERDENVENTFHEVLSWLETAEESKRMDLGENLGQALKVGAANLRVLELMDAGHNRRFGAPTPGDVQITPKAGKCILVSGHDMNDLDTILKYTEDKGVNVFTHGEMLPAHGYPGLRKFKGRIFTTNAVGWPGVTHLNMGSKASLELLVNSAQSMQGFTEEQERKSERKTLTVGFGHNAILSHAETVINAVKSGALKRIFLVGGCDGSEHKRNYFTDLVDLLPPETLILTLGCAKYRFNRLRDFGTLGDSGIPRLLDMGQCNDSYGAVKVALALADAFETDINSLPVSLCISWFEQKAVAVLLTLLHLGVRNIHLGPVMPAFVTEEVAEILREKFNLTPIELRFKRDAAQDIQQMMQG